MISTTTLTKILCNRKRRQHATVNAKKKMKRGARTIISVCSASLLYFLLGTNIYSNTTRQLYEYSGLSRHAAYNTTNPHENGWCKNAICHNNPICAPCNRRYLFILSPSRAGSTTLLSMFNRLPGLRLSAEKYNELNKVSVLFHHTLNKTDIFQYDGNATKYYNHAIPNESLPCAAQQLVNFLNPPPMRPMQDIDFNNNHQHESRMILGMRTVRLSRGSINAFTPAGAVKFLEENFPCSRFIIAKRSDYQAHAKSMYTRFNAGTKLPLSHFTHLVESEGAFYDAIQTHLGSDKALTVDLDEWMTNVEVLNDAVSWLGFTNCRFDGVLHENHHGEFNIYLIC